MPKLKEKLAQEYALNPKHCMPGFVPMGRTDDAYLAGFDKAKEMVLKLEYYSGSSWVEVPRSVIENLGEVE